MRIHALNRFFSLLLPVALTVAILPATAIAQSPTLQARDGSVPSVPIGVLAGRHQPVEETFGLPSALTAAMARTGVDEHLEVPGFPTGPGLREALHLRRIDVYAPQARVFVLDASGQREVERSRRFHFVGYVEGAPERRVALSFDPSSGGLRGAVHTPQGASVIDQFSDFDAQSSIIRQSSKALESQGIQLHSSCGADLLPTDPAPLEPRFKAQPLQSIASAATVTRSAIIAIDTDNEFNYFKFANDTVAAIDWIADLFVEMNVMYERDLGLRLIQGDTFLRLDSGDLAFDDDPYHLTSSGASGAHLDEFGTFWQNNMPNVPRVFAALLSGKSGNNYSSSGIAWLDGYCESQSYGGGYSVTQVFKANVNVANDARIVGHEIGHNMGSPHTHCYSPAIDQCYSAEGGCYNGPTSCPAAGSGTLMSYCHLLGGCGATATLHSRVVDLMDTYLQSHSGWCVAPNASDEIFEDDFETASTASWSAITN